MASAMSETKVRAPWAGEDSIYLDAARNRYMGAISLGYGPDGKRIRRKVSGKTKQEVRAKLQALHQEMIGFQRLTGGRGYYRPTARPGTGLPSRTWLHSAAGLPCGPELETHSHRAQRVIGGPAGSVMVKVPR